MKKVLLLILALVMCLSLCNCGGEKNKDANTAKKENSEQETVEPKITKEDMLGEATELDLAAFADDVIENKLRAEDSYLNKYFTLTSYVVSVEDDHAKIGVLYDSGYRFNAYMPVDDLKQLNRGQMVEIVGEITSFDVETETRETTYSSKEISYVGVDMNSAFLVNGTYEVTGTVNMFYESYINIDGNRVTTTGKETSWRFYISEEGVKYNLDKAVPVEHNVGVDIDSVMIGESQVNDDDVVTLSGIIINSSIENDDYLSIKPDYYMTDVEVVTK